MALIIHNYYCNSFQNFSQAEITSEFKNSNGSGYTYFLVHYNTFFVLLACDEDSESRIC